MLFICVDDLNDWIGVLGGHPQAVTPNHDKMASWGTLFTNAHCAAPSCNPSRVATLTGMLPSASGIYTNNEPFRPAFPDAVTLMQHFRANGYRAVGAGKMFHAKFPDPNSWDDYFPGLCEQKPKDFKPDNRPLNGMQGSHHFDWGPIDIPKEEMGDYAVASYVIEQLGKLGDTPTFVSLGLWRPHLPFYVPRGYFDRFPLDSIQLPRTKMDDLEDIPPPPVSRLRTAATTRRCSRPISGSPPCGATSRRSSSPTRCSGA